jgi:transposase
VIARARSAEYARAATAAAPEAPQVADRWHLRLNARQMVERWRTGAHARLRSQPAVPDAAVDAPRRAGAFPRTRADTAARAERRARRRAVYEEVPRRHHAGEPLLAISRALGRARGTVRRYASAEALPERATHPLHASILDPVLAHLAARQAGGCENAMTLWREIRAMGYGGTARQVHRWLQARRTVPAPSTPRAYRGRGSAPAPEAASAGVRPPPKQLAWVLLQPPTARSPAAVATAARVAQDDEAARVIPLVQRFAALGRDRAAEARAARDAYETWLDDALRCGGRVLASFAAGLQQDGAAVRAALTTPWSNAQAEGHITTRKLLKRPMYGRANFDLLRRRVWLAT